MPWTSVHTVPSRRARSSGVYKGDRAVFAASETLGFVCLVIAMALNLVVLVRRVNLT